MRRVFRRQERRGEERRRRAADVDGRVAVDDVRVRATGGCRVDRVAGVESEDRSLGPASKAHVFKGRSDPRALLSRRAARCYA